MFKAIVILLMVAAIIKAENVPNDSETIENSDDVSSSAEESHDGSISSHILPVEVALEDSEELSKTGVQENTDISIAAASLINEQLKKFGETDSLVASSPKFRRSEVESERDVSVNDDQKSEEANSESFNDEKIKEEDEIASASTDSTEESEVYRPPAEDDSNIKEYSEEKPDVIANLGEISGRRMLQQDIVLDTKGRSAHDSEAIDNFRAVPPTDFRTLDVLNPLDIRPTYKNDLIMPHYPSLPRSGMFYNPAFMANPMLFNQMGSKEMINPNYRNFASGYEPSQSKSSQEIRTVGNAYPFQPPLTAHTGEIPSNNLDIFWKLSEGTELLKPQLPFSAERRSAYQRSFNQFGVPRFRRSALNMVHSMKLKDSLPLRDNHQVL